MTAIELAAPARRAILLRLCFGPGQFISLFAYARESQWSGALNPAEGKLQQQWMIFIEN